MNPTTIALVTPFDYQPFHSIRQLCDLLTTQLQALGHEVIPLTPSAPLASLTRHASSLHRVISAIERLTYSPAALRLRLQTLERKAKALKRDFVVLLCDQSLGLLAGALSGFRVVCFVSDLIAPQAAFGAWGQPTSFGRRFVQQMSLTGLKSASAYLCPSRATANDLERLLPDAAQHTTLAPLPLPQPFAPLPADDLAARQAQLWRQKNLLPQPYVLHVGSSAWYKGRPALLHLMAALAGLTPTPPALALAGAAPTADEEALARRLSVTLQSFTGLSSAELNTLYSGAQAVILPSAAEGFGWPALEALASGTLLAITDTPALSEHFSAAASLILPAAPTSAEDDSLSAWAAKQAPELLSLLQLSAQERQALVAQGLLHAKENFTEASFREALQKSLQSLTS